MSVFRNYNSKPVGDVLRNALPMVTPVPWTPSQRNVRANPNIPTQPQRITPTERGTYFPTSASGGGTLAAAMSSGCSSCGGCSGCGQSMASPSSTTMSASDISTQHSFPSSNGSVVASSHMAPFRRGTGMLHPNTPVQGTLSKAGGRIKARVSLVGGR
jgi:hypothetical protein